MAWLLDTNVISELRKGSRANRGVQAWFSTVEDADLHTSVLVIGEIRRGIERLAPRDPPSARALERWARTLETQFADRILPITLEISDSWGRQSPDRPMPTVDGLLAATARHHGLILVTRNVADVGRSGVDVLNPFD
jgi:predicted nucleic acid-binding protein